MREGISRAADSAADYASDIKERVSDTASAYADSISEFAQDTTRAVSERSSRLGRQAQSTLQDGVERVLRDQPLAVAVAGLAAGAAVAALFPSTEMEGRTLGGAREALTGAAGKAGEMVMDAAEKAKERLQNAAEERGFSTAGLQGLASEVAADLHRCGRRQVRQPTHRSEEFGIRFHLRPHPRWLRRQPEPLGSRRETRHGSKP